jgi:hypothetical protein
MICCGHDDGTAKFDSWDEADAFRRHYNGEGDTSGTVNPHGYDERHAHKPGHQRVAVIVQTA